MSTGKPAKPVIRGKGKALNTIAAASGRDPVKIFKSVAEAEVPAETATPAQTQAVDVEGRRAASRDRANTKDPAIESQAFNQLTPQEKFRFTCFRRCGFASKPIERFVANMLIGEMETRRMVRRGTLVGLGCRLGVEGGSSNDDSQFSSAAPGVISDTSDADNSSSVVNRKRKRHSRKQILMNESRRRQAVIDQSQHCLLDGPLRNSGQATQALANLVVANSASEIVSVVSTLAKCYGQRLVAAAKTIAKAEDGKIDVSGTSSTYDPTSSSTLLRPLEPRHFIDAHQKLARAGLDPGFWLGDHVGLSNMRSAFHLGEEVVAESGALGVMDRNRLFHLAALAAGDLHDGELEEDDEKKRVDEEIMMDINESEHGDVAEMDGISESTYS
jgi:hypothetical protein